MSGRYPHKDPWVAYVGPFGFPNGGAPARRVLGNAQSLVGAGYRVVVASGDFSGPLDPTGEDGISVVSLHERTKEHWPRPLRRLAYAVMGRETRRWLNAQTSRPFAVVLYGGYTPYLFQLLPWCRRHKVPLLFDAVEWYEAYEPLGGLLSPYQWNIELAMRHLVKMTDGVVAISQYLTQYYRTAGLPVLRVPPTLRIRDLPPRNPFPEDPRLHLCYAGVPGPNKDLLDEVIAAAVAIDEAGHRLRLHVAGPIERDLLRFPSLTRRYQSLPPCIKSYGRIPHHSAVSLMQSCDFTLLPRRENRVTKAGFSTKFVESLALGTPVIANITGDLNEFLHDRETGLVCDRPSVAALKTAFTRALTTPSRELHAMRRNCTEIASARFDVGAYSEALGSFVHTIATKVSAAPSATFSAAGLVQRR